MIGNFTTPTSDARRRANNPYPAKNSQLTLAAFAYLNDFEPKRVPARGDWLDDRDWRDEKQTFLEWKKRVNKKRIWPRKKRKKIRLVPVGNFSQYEALLPIISEYVSIFYSGCDIICDEEEPVDLELITCRPRFSCKQYLAPEILSVLQLTKKTESDFCTMGITMSDLYPKPEWNFVFGLAKFTRRAGIFSFHRYLPRQIHFPVGDVIEAIDNFNTDDGACVSIGMEMTVKEVDDEGDICVDCHVWEKCKWILEENFKKIKIKQKNVTVENTTEEKDNDDFLIGDLDAKNSQLFLRRCFMIVTHEIGHLFGLKHCIYYECIMNGVNHLSEADNAPLSLCPICLHKIAEAMKPAGGFDIHGRYANLLDIYERFHLEKEAEFMKQRLSHFKAEN